MQPRFVRVNSNPISHGVIKSKPADFFVAEHLPRIFSGEGEHLYLYLEKEGQNTEYVAKQLARKFGVKPMDVGFSGLKDRWAVTRQWFSIYVRNRVFDDIDLSDIEGVRLLQQERDVKKLRRGEHDLNHFRLVIRNVSDVDSVSAGLEQIKQNGFPNYFGEQRFGRQGQNLERAARWFNGEIKVSRSQRSFYLSAVRSYLFNEMLVEHVESGTWMEGEGPLYGDDAEGVLPLSNDELAFYERFPDLVSGLHKNRMTLARRPYKMYAENLDWEFDGSTLTMSFDLLPGAFATSLLNELFDVVDASGVEASSVR